MNSICGALTQFLRITQFDRSVTCRSSSFVAQKMDVVLCVLVTIIMFSVRRQEEEEQEVSDVWKYNEVRVLSSRFTSVHTAFTTCHKAPVYRPAVRRFKTCVWITSTQNISLQLQPSANLIPAVHDPPPGLT